MKAMVCTLLAVLSLCGCSLRKPKAKIPESSSLTMMVHDVVPRDEFADRNILAQDIYDADNAQFFESALPNAIVRFKHLEGALAKTVFAETNHPIIYIDIDSNGSSNQLHMNMFHEECHIAEKGPRPVRGSDHNMDFQACLLKLANAGAMREWW